MPIEIKELHIRVTVDDPQPGARDNSTNTGDGNSASPVANDALVAKCVEQIMDIINKKKER